MKDCIVNLVLNLYALFLKVQPTGLASVLPVQAPTLCTIFLIKLTVLFVKSSV